MLYILFRKKYENKEVTPIDSKLIIHSFNHQNLTVIDNYEKLEETMFSLDLTNSVLLMMSSGKFGGLDLEKLKKY